MKQALVGLICLVVLCALALVVGINFRKIQKPRMRGPEDMV